MINEYYVMTPTRNFMMQELEGVAMPKMRVGELVIFQCKEYEVKSIIHDLDRQRRTYVLDFKCDLVKDRKMK
jgi:hypothetical protein